MNTPMKMNYQKLLSAFRGLVGITCLAIGVIFIISAFFSPRFFRLVFLVSVGAGFSMISVAAGWPFVRRILVRDHAMSIWTALWTLVCSSWTLYQAVNLQQPLTMTGFIVQGGMLPLMFWLYLRYGRTIELWVQRR